MILIRDVSAHRWDTRTHDAIWLQQSDLLEEGILLSRHMMIDHLPDVSFEVLRATARRLQQTADSNAAATRTAASQPTPTAAASAATPAGRNADGMNGNAGGTNGNTGGFNSNAGGTNGGAAMRGGASSAGASDVESLNSGGASAAAWGRALASVLSSKQRAAATMDVVEETTLEPEITTQLPRFESMAREDSVPHVQPAPSGA